MTLRTLIAIAALTVAAPGGAVVQSWTIDHPFASGYVVPVDLGATIAGITEVTVDVAGVGGEQRFSCGPAHENYTFPLYLYLDFDRDNSSGVSAAVATFEDLPELGEPFTREDKPALAHAWEFLQDGQFRLTARWFHLPYPSSVCYDESRTDPVITSLTLNITCAGIVPAESGAWGAVKALFR